jgi:hypothetical protein
LIVAALTLTLGALAAPRWGSMGAAVSYLVATALIGLPFALTVFARVRQSYLNLQELPVYGSDVSWR